MKKGKTIRGKSTLRQRIILCMGLCVGLCLLILTAFFYTVVRMMEENRVQAAMESNVQSLSASFDDSYYFLLQISQQMTPEGNVDTIAEDLWQSQEAYDRIQYGKQLSSSVSIMMFASTDVTMVAYYRQEDGEGAQPWFSTFPERDAFQIEDQPILLQTNELTFHGLHRSQNRFVDKNVVSVCRPIEFHTGDRFLIYVELYSTVLDTLDQAARTQEMEYTLLQLDDKQEIRYSSSGAFPVGDFLELTEQGQVTVAEDRAGKKYVCLLEQGRFGYHTAVLAPLEQYSGEVWFWTGSLILMVLLVTAAVVISLVLVSRLIYRPMHLLEQEIEQVGKGDLSMSHHGSLNIQEFDVLFERIQVMKQEISGLMDDIREQEQEKQKLELSNLYYQINPHFLMNALNSVHWMAVTRGQKEIDSFIYYLNYILGYSLGKTNRKATFRTELQSLEAYLELQKMRYDFKTEFQVGQGDYLDYPCARLILQPIAENAVCHNMDEFGTLWFTMRRESEDWVRMEIRDDGKGFVVDSAPRQGEKPSQQSRNNKGIGLQYVCRCLESFYGDRAEMLLESTPGVGTTVTIRVPLRTSWQDQAEGTNDQRKG